MRRMSKPSPAEPLTSAVFHILLALCGRERHGYRIIQQVNEDSRRAVKTGPGTLYGSLDRVIASVSVIESDTRDPRRIYCRLTVLGRASEARKRPAIGGGCHNPSAVKVA